MMAKKIDEMHKQNEKRAEELEMYMMRV